MTTETMTPAQERMAKARAARSQNKFNGADPASFDHDGDGSPGGSLPDDILATAKAQRAAKEAAELAAAQREAKTRGETPRPEGAGPSPQQRAAAAQEAAAAAREEAARAFAEGAAAPGVVRVRVTKQGDGKVSRGIHAPGIGEVHYAWKDEFEVAAPVAQALEERYFVEIL